MGVGLLGTLHIAKTALNAAQTAIKTTAHNVANANTPGYTRQRMNVTSGDPVLLGNLVIQSGVVVTGIERIYDSFLGSQIEDATEDMGRYGMLNTALSHLEGIFNDAQGMGLGPVLDDFFSSLHNVANDSASVPLRTVLLSKAQSLEDRINSLDSRLRDEIGNIESQISGEVTDINSLATRIASLNDKVQGLEASGQAANDLRDQREVLLKELAGKINTTVLEESNGSVTVLAAGGSPVVAGSSTTSLSVSADSDNHGYYDIYFGSVDITSRITSGNLKGLIEARDGEFRSALNGLDTLTASITKEFNVIHYAGYGLDSTTTNNLFNALTTTSATKSANTGTATIASNAIATGTRSSLTLENYEIQFTSTTLYNVVNVTDGTTLVTGATYASGVAIPTFDGISVTITDGAGTPQSGDVFTVNTTEDAARDFGLSLTDVNKFAAATSTATLPGSNANVLSLINLGDSKVLSNSSATFSTYYASLVSSIGVATSAAETNDAAQNRILEELNAYRESISGVSLDEEAANLIRYQHAYQAAARILSIVDEMLETIINLR